MLIGLIWSALAPLSLVLLAACIAWGLRRARVRWALPIGALLVAVPVAVIWKADRAAFETICTGEGKPVVMRRASADGIFLNSGTANSFGMRYLHDEGFKWVEAPSIYTRGAWVRYALDSASQTPNAISTTEIPEITARYEVREDFSEPFPHTGLSQTKVIDRVTGEVLAKAGSANFRGGRMTWVLGAWGMSSCPNAMRAPEDFAMYYHLAKRTLR